MPGSTADLFRQVAAPSSRAVVTSLQQKKNAGSATCELALSTGWVDGNTSAVDVVIYRKHIGGVLAGQADSSTQTDWVAVRIGTTLTGMVLKAGVEPADGYAADANTVVMCTPTAAWANDLVKGLLAGHNPDGSFKSKPVQDALGVSGGAAGGWDILNAGVAPVVEAGATKGNKEFDLKFTAADLTAVLTPGMRLKFNRSGTTPTQCADFERDSSQLASRASGSVVGIGFTDDFTCEAWIKLESYASSPLTIVSRRSGGTGWQFRIEADGRVSIVGLASSGNHKHKLSYQSVPLGRWVHVAASLDMSASTASIYIDGASVPVTSADLGTATALTVAGDLMIGNYTGATEYFDGKIFDTRVWATVRTQPQIRDNMNQQLAGNETGLVGYWKLTGNFNDATANANNLTASGGAIATDTDNPFKATEYCIVTKITKPAADTIATVFTGTDHNIPNASLSQPFYSTQKTPYGFPSDRNRWQVRAIINFNNNANITTFSTWRENNHQLSVPTGAWAITHGGSYGQTNSTAGLASTRFALARSTETTPSADHLVFTFMDVATPNNINDTFN